MRIKSFKFNISEFAGSMGDFGTLIPLAVGYIIVCGLDPAGLLIMIGIAKIVTGLFFKIPMSVEPMKVIAVVAIAQQWTPSMVYAAGFATGIIWIAFAATGVIKWVERVTPKSVVNGIQAALGIIFAIKAFELMTDAWVIGILSVVIVLLLRNSRYAPATIVLILAGIIYIFIKGDLKEISPPAFAIPQFTSFTINDIWQVLFLAVFAQIPLTITNATIATSSLIKSYWPEKNISSKQISWSHSIMNTLPPLAGGMPLCHGAGGLAGKHYFGARTGGANIIIGTAEILLGLFFSASIVTVFMQFPMAIIGGMMLLVGFELTKFARSTKLNIDIVPLVITIAVAVLTNMAIGFILGTLTHYLIKFIKNRIL